MVLYVIVLFGSLKLQQILCQLAPHMDFQKVDAIMYDNSKYNVLKPTIHITRDHFKDFVLNRHNSDFPGRKVIIDKNGIRHYWTGLVAPRHKSLRKTILETADTSLYDGKATSKTAEITTKKKPNNLDMNKEGKLNDTENSEATVKVKNKPRRKKKVSEPIATVALDKLSLRKDKTRVKATFFCPFFGVITMMSHID